MNLKQSLILLAAAGLQAQVPANACTGITLKSSDGAVVAARTVEWAESVMNTMYVVVPRHQELQSLTPSGMDGMKFTTRYGFIGLSVEQKEFMVEGVNEKGLSAGLFYFPNYGEYPPYDPAQKEKSLADFQLVSYVLGECSTVDEVKEKLRNIRVTNIDPRSSTVHWRFTEPSGRQVVLEIVNEVMHFYDNPLGVLTNSPGLEWHWTNLNNYINLQPGTLPEHNYGPLQMVAFGVGIAIGLPRSMDMKRAAPNGTALEVAFVVEIIILLALSRFYIPYNIGLSLLSEAGEEPAESEDEEPVSALSVVCPSTSRL